MIIFNVVKEQHGWAVRMGQRMTTPFWSKDLAVREANRLADGIRRHGEVTEVIVESGFGQAVGRESSRPALGAGFQLRPEIAAAALNSQL